MRALIPALCAMACAPVVTERTVDTFNEVCVDGDEIVATFAACLSSSCDTLLSSSCEATLSGSVLEVTGEAAIRTEGEVCTADCGLVTARCAIPAGVDRSTVILTFGGDDGGPVLEDAACGD